MPQFVTRAEATKLIHNRLTQGLDELQLQHMRLPSVERMRNYEFESKLHQMFGGEWCISELCPFNGEFCQFGSIQSQEMFS